MTVRSARATRPWRPITLPTSSVGDVQVEDDPAVLVLPLLDMDRVRVVDELAGEVLEQLSQCSWP